MVIYVTNLYPFQGATSEMPAMMFSLSDPFLSSLSVLSLGDVIWICSFNYQLSAYEYPYSMSSSCLPSALRNSSTIAYLVSLLINIKGTANMLIQSRLHRLPLPTLTTPYLLPFQCSLYLPEVTTFLCPGLRNLPWQSPLSHTPLSPNLLLLLTYLPKSLLPPGLAYLMSGLDNYEGHSILASLQFSMQQPEWSHC